MPFFNLAGKFQKAFKALDKKMGGVLPLGGTPIQPEVLNRLPVAVNLGYRYMSGTGAKDLKLPEKFKRGAVQLGISPGPKITYLDTGRTKNVNKTPGEILPGEIRPVSSYRAAGVLAPYVDTSTSAYGGQRPIDREPEAAPYRSTLGRYNVEGLPESYRVTDTFDLVNEFENKELLTPGRKPLKAFGASLMGFVDPSNFLRAYAYMRDTPLKAFPIEFEVPRSYGTEWGP